MQSVILMQINQAAINGGETLTAFAAILFALAFIATIATVIRLGRIISGKYPMSALTARAVGASILWIAYAIVAGGLSSVNPRLDREMEQYYTIRYTYSDGHSESATARFNDLRLAGDHCLNQMFLTYGMVQCSVFGYDGHVRDFRKQTDGTITDNNGARYTPTP